MHACMDKIFKELIKILCIFKCKIDWIPAREAGRLTADLCFFSSNTPETILQPYPSSVADQLLQSPPHLHGITLVFLS